MMQLAYPVWIWLYLLLPVVGVALYIQFRRSHSLIKLGLLGVSTRFLWLKLGIKGLALILLLVAVLGPYFPKSQSTSAFLAREIYVLLDVSASMNAQDLSPSRLYKAKRVIRQLLSHLKADRLGLIVFSDDAFLQCPLTQDYEMFETLLELAETRQFSRNGTQYRPALSMALEHFQDSLSDKWAHNKAVVLISDGEDHGDTYPSLLDRFKKAKIPIYCLGIGTHSGGKIPLPNAEGWLKDAHNQEVNSKLVPQSLQAISNTFNTPYFEVSANAQSAKELASEIEETRLAPLDSQIQFITQTVYAGFVGCAILLLLFDLFILPSMQITPD